MVAGRGKGGSKLDLCNLSDKQRLSPSQILSPAPVRPDTTRLRSASSPPAALSWSAFLLQSSEAPSSPICSPPLLRRLAPSPSSCVATGASCDSGRLSPLALSPSAVAASSACSCPPPEAKPLSLLTAKVCSSVSSSSFHGGRSCARRRVLRRRRMRPKISCRSCFRLMTR